ncbi:small multi-drug export protein [Alkalicoccobacillus gibsonii]|uniref:small multi-drug export protein n=1 Tax=Alkalicoccobacillus gibsonii TaxID=79881 RepID=UPI003512A865
MGYLIAYIVVFLLAATPFFEAIAIIPIGGVAGLNVFLTGFIALLGNIITVLLVIVFIESIQAWREKRRIKKGKPEKTKKSERAQRVFTKYGLPGLCLIGPTVGSHLTALIAMSLSGSKVRTAIWMSISLTLWCAGMAVFTHLGFEYLLGDAELSNTLRDFIENY